MIFKQLNLIKDNLSKYYLNNSRNVIHHIKPDWIPFYKAKYGNFAQEPPVLRNQFVENVFLKNYLCHHFTKELYSELESDLIQFGERVSTNIYYLGLECELNKPYLRPISAWNSDKNELVVCDAWKKQKDISAQEGLISIGYNRKKYDRWARLYQFTKLYLYSPSSGLFSCPLAMTDGATKTFSALSLLEDIHFQNVYNKLTSTDPRTFWTSGQWMTEKGGGSDVANGTETVALPINARTYKLYGLKWFSSATDANMALTLARISDDEGNVVQGGKGLTLFYVPVKDNDGPIEESINIIKLKDKLGTRQLPTAELLLDGVPAIKISEEGRGISAISHMLQITRLHNAICCAAYIQRAFSIARDYSQRRKAFGKRIIDLPLHIQTLSRINLIAKATAIFAFENIRLLDLIEYNIATDEEQLLFRILNPLAKLYNAKAALSAVSECIECIGGQGIIEDTGIPYLYRDVQIFSIWEGTTSVLAIDVLRSIIKTNRETLKALRSNVKNRLKSVFKNDELKETALKVLFSLDELIKIVEEQPLSLESGARDFAFSLSNIFISTLLLENAIFLSSSKEKDIYILQAIRFVNSQNINEFKTNYQLNEYSPLVRQNDHDALLVDNIR